MADSPRRILVLGGARSGKSAFAQRAAARLGGPVLFVATATVEDAEMSARVAAHRAARPAHWETLEASVDVGNAIRGRRLAARTILVDCLTLLTSNTVLALSKDRDNRRKRPPPKDGGPALLGAPQIPEPENSDSRLDETTCMRAIGDEIASIVSAADALNAHLIVVSGEVGLGIVPTSHLGRLYRDVLGGANQMIAAQADAVFLMIAGIGVDLKRVGIEDPTLIDLGVGSSDAR